MEYRETSEDGVVTCYAVSNAIVSGRRTPRGQVIDILESPVFGKMLFIDGEGQSSEVDQHIYHKFLLESWRDPDARKVLILGGGEGATLEQALKVYRHAQVTMVEWDQTMVDLAKLHLGNWHKGAFDDPRATIVYEDAREWLTKSTETFDVILIDLPDSFAVPSILPLLDRVMTPDAVVTMQAGPCNVLNRGRLAKLMQDWIVYMGEAVLYASPHIPFFQTPWAFLTNKDSISVPDYANFTISW